MKAQKRVTWPEVLRALPVDETRSYALGRFRDPCFSPDSFATRIESRAIVAEGMTRTEDWLELNRRPKQVEAIRAVRRRLELELWS